MTTYLKWPLWTDCWRQTRAGGRGPRVVSQVEHVQAAAGLLLLVVVVEEEQEQEVLACRRFLPAPPPHQDWNGTWGGGVGLWHP